MQEALNNLEDFDKTCLEAALQGVSNVMQQEWGSSCPCQVLWITLIYSVYEVVLISPKHEFVLISQNHGDTQFKYSQ